MREIKAGWQVHNTKCRGIACIYDQLGERLLTRNIRLPPGTRRCHGRYEVVYCLLTTLAAGKRWNEERKEQGAGASFRCIAKLTTAIRCHIAAITTSSDSQPALSRSGPLDNQVKPPPFFPPYPPFPFLPIPPPLSSIPFSSSFIPPLFPSPSFPEFQLKVWRSAVSSRSGSGAEPHWNWI